MAWLFSAGREDSAVFFRVAMVVGPLFVLFGAAVMVKPRAFILSDGSREGG